MVAVDAAVRRVLERQLTARLVAIAVSVPVAAVVHERDAAVRYALVALVLWAPWAILWSRLLRRGTKSLWCLGLGDVVAVNLGLVQFDPEGWIIAQIGGLVAVTTVGLTGDRWQTRLVTAGAVIAGAASSWFVDLPPVAIVSTLLGLLACAALVGATTVSTSHELGVAATTAALDPGTQLATRGSLVRFLGDGLAHGDQVTVAIFRMQGLDELAAAFGRDHADQTLRALEPELSGHRDTFISVVDSSTIALAARRDATDTELDERVGRHLAEMALIPSLRDLGAHVGWALGPTDSDDASDLVRIAERAARTAADVGEGVRRASPDDALSVARRLELLASLRSITDSDDFAVHFQPQIDVSTRRIVGVEALARWTHPRLGPIRPDEFIHLAEIAGLLPEITMEVLARSIRQVAAWRTEGLDLTMSVNVSVVDLRRPHFRDQLLDLWLRHGVEPGALVLEITETQTSIPAEIDGTLRSLADAGVRFAIDDYGTGHSSLLRVRDLPVTELKVDRAFVGSMLVSGADDVIVSSTLQLGRTLGLEIVAEGVEDEATLRRLEAMGCHRAQGFLVSPAVPADQIPELCHRWSSEPADALDRVQKG